MPSLIDIVIRGRDTSGPAFQSAATNLARLTQGGTQASTGLARVEHQATETGSAIITLGIAGSTTQTRMRSLTVSIVNQEQALRLAEQRLHEVRAAHDAESLAVGRAQLAYDRLNRSLVNNRARMQDLRASGDISGISVVGMGGGGAGAAGLMAGAQAIAGPLGIALGTQELLQFGASSIAASNSLERTQGTIRALSQTQERYTEVLELARRNQDLYGGSTQRNLEAFRGLIPLANSANIALSELDQTTRLLAAFQPEQGAQGAAVALREFLTASGAEGARSLAERFELNRAALQAIIASTDDATERTRQLNQVLADQGITTKLLTDQVNLTANSYDRLGAAADRAKTTVGGGLAEALVPQVETLTQILNIISGDFSGLSLEGLYRSGFRASGIRGEELDRRMQALPFGFGPQGGTTINNYNVQGSLVTEKQIADTTRRNNAQTAARNGGRR